MALVLADAHVCSVVLSLLHYDNTFSDLKKTVKTDFCYTWKSVELSINIIQCLTALSRVQRSSEITIHWRGGGKNKYRSCQYWTTSTTKKQIKQINKLQQINYKSVFLFGKLKWQPDNAKLNMIEKIIRIIVVRIYHEVIYILNEIPNITKV